MNTGAIVAALQHAANVAYAAVTELTQDWSPERRDVVMSITHQLGDKQDAMFDDAYAEHPRSTDVIIAQVFTEIAGLRALALNIEKHGDVWDGEVW